jgi:6-pyruvoyl-tetrahydropterin synthase
VSRWVVHAAVELDARHALLSYGGRPEESHQHRWRVAIAAATGALNDEGYAIDFHALRELLGDRLAPLEGSDLNLHPEIGRPTPSAERLAEVVAGWLEPEVEALGGTLIRVSVWEGPENRIDLELS